MCLPRTFRSLEGPWGKQNHKLNSMCVSIGGKEAWISEQLEACALNTYTEPSSALWEFIHLDVAESPQHRVNMNDHR